MLHLTYFFYFNELLLAVTQYYFVEDFLEGFYIVRKQVVVESSSSNGISIFLHQNPAQYPVYPLPLRFYILHCVFIPLVVAVLIAIHFWRVRKDGGISAPL